MRENLRIGCYRILQASVRNQKLAPFLTRKDAEPYGSVLELGCGPGGNASLFDPKSYLGIDIDRSALDVASRQFSQHQFVYGDIREFRVDRKFDTIFINSVLHHLDDAGTGKALATAQALCKPGGTLHLLDLVSPRRPGVAALLALLDKGSHSRTVERWQELIGEYFSSSVVVPYEIRIGGVVFWKMIYLCGSMP